MFAGWGVHQVKSMSKRRARLRPEAEAAQFIISGSDKPCLKAQWINDYKGTLDIIPDVIHERYQTSW